MDRAEHWVLPRLRITTVATATVTYRDVDSDHVAGMIGRIEAFAAEAAGIVGAACPAPVGGFSGLEDMTAGLTAGGFCVLGTLDRSLCLFELQHFPFHNRAAIRKEQSHVFGLPSGETPEEAGEEVLGGGFIVAVVVRRG